MVHISSIILRFGVFFSVFLVFQGTELRAQSVFDLLGNPLPEIDFMSDAEFLAQTDLHEEIPFDDEMLAYQVRLPKGWIKKGSKGQGRLGLSQDVLGEIGSYVSPARLEDARSEFRVQALSLSHDVAAGHWFLQHVLSNAYNLEGIQEHNNRRVEAMYVVIIDGTSFVVRAVAIKNGRRIILSEFFVPQQQWQTERVLSTQAMAGFKLLNTDDSYVQTLKTFKFLDIAQYSYPERWEIRGTTIRTTDRMHSKILNANRQLKVLNGQMDVYVVSAAVVDSLEEELLRFKDILKDKGLELGPLLDVWEDFGFDETMKFGVVEAYEANNSNLRLIEYEMWIAIMSSGEYYYFVPMLTPKRTEDFTVWSRNVGDFRVVVENTRPITDKPALEEWKSGE